MGAQKKCFLLLNTIICFIFFTFILITFLKDYFFSSKTKNKNNNDAIFIIIIIIFISFILWIYLLFKTFKKDIKLYKFQTKKIEKKILII
jgi:membrane protease YdiL (CAAX protease family)